VIKKVLAKNACIFNNSQIRDLFLKHFSYLVPTLLFNDSGVGFLLPQRLRNFFLDLFKKAIYVMIMAWSKVYG